MVTDDDEIKDVDWTDDILGNFSEGEYAVVDKGQLSEVRVCILSIGENGIEVQDKAGNQYTVNVLRLSK